MSLPEMVEGIENPSEFDPGQSEPETPNLINEDILENENVITFDGEVDLSGSEAMYFHADCYSKIWFEHLVTSRNQEETTVYGIFTSPPDGDIATRNFCGVVTDQYKFISNEAVVHAVLTSLGELGGGEIDQHYYISDNHVSFREDISINRRSRNIDQVGIVVPTITVENSYNGSKAASYSFGLEIRDGDIRHSITFREKIASMRQVHIITSRTSMTSNIGDYMSVFDDNITDLITSNFEQMLLPEDVMKSLKLVEKLGKKRYKAVAVNLAELVNNEDTNIDLENPPAVSVWKMFQAIAKFSAVEENLNAKKMLDSIAERTLVIPSRMIQSLT